MRTTSSLLLLALAAHALPASGQPAGPLLGFSPEKTAAQIALETRFDTYLSREDQRAWLIRMTERPQHVGSLHGKENAEFVADLFRSWGYQTEIETFHVLFPTPREGRLEMVSPVRYLARLHEPVLAEDATSGVRTEMLPPYNAYSADGDVTAELVYVNYGIPADYEELERRGIDVKGKIVLARYGGSWRGIKPKVAAEHGAIGCIIYSDPRDDGYFQGDVYPKGAFRPEHGTQRGSVVDMPLYPGDPLTPGIGATEAADRLSLDEAPTLMKIPVLPISYGDALPLLEALDGAVAPESWRGALPVTYHLGPGPATVRLTLSFNWDLAPAYNVIARLPGAVYPDQWIVRGNHRDAWVFGAADPASGMAALLDEARAVGELARAGWRPARTIVYASWDAEEPGLLGSTEWVELHADELRDKVVAYINSDGNGRGFLTMSGSQSLERFLNQVARDVPDPQMDVSVAERGNALLRLNGDGARIVEGDHPVAPLGSGSDYTPFLQHLGIASLNIGYGGEDEGGSYHSIYDSYDHFLRFGDPNLDYGIALAMTGGRATLRLAEAPVLPFRFSNLARHVDTYVKEVKELTDRMRKATEETNERIDSGAYTLASDPLHPLRAPERKDPVPYLNFAPLENALADLKTSAGAYDATLLATGPDVASPGSESLVRLNEQLFRTERALTREEGLPRRSWFRHQIYAPGFYTGYGVKTLPGVREAIEERNWSEAEEQIRRLAETLTQAAETYRQAAELLARE